MNLNEFKAWFEGYTEEIKKAPTQKQWKRICEKLEEVGSSQYWPHTYTPTTTTWAVGDGKKTFPCDMTSSSFYIEGQQEAKQ